MAAGKRRLAGGGDADRDASDAHMYAAQYEAADPALSETNRQYARGFRDIDNTYAERGIPSSHNPPGHYAGGLDKAMSKHADRVHPVKRR